MIRDTTFRISQRPYAVDLTTLRWQVNSAAAVGEPRHQGTINAVWFRRRSGKTVACIGTLWDYQPERAADAVAFLQAHTDGKHGGDCDGRWDGTSYWGNVPLDVQEKHLAILRPMLANYPEAPASHDAWWRF